MKVSKSGLFLFELIVVILLFTVSSAVCINIFAKSYSFSNQSESLTKSSLKAETAAEVFKETNGDVDAITKALKADNDTYDVIMTEQDGLPEYTLNVYYDEMWSNTDEINKRYILTVKTEATNKTKVGNVISANISVKDKDKPLFTIDAKKYLPAD